ncbi:MAG: NAD(P)/FAD-dependent oxidoreductase [Planctomycetota bacterium]
MTGKRPRVVIIGGGFGGLYAARALRGAPVDISIVDKSNHHLFQPLLYQVATAGLSPADIAAPTRHVLSRQRNVEVVLAKVESIDLERRLVHGDLPYDVLILAAGVRTSYFGNDHWESIAPGLKTIDDATEIRRRFLLAFEHAEFETDAEARRSALTFVIVGAGPTGVELAGTMVHIARQVIPRDFRHVNTATARVILVEGGDRVLPTFPESLSLRAKRDLEELGVEVRLNAFVNHVDADGVQVGDERIGASNVFWAAGVRGAPLVESLGVELTGNGRIAVGPDLSIDGHPDVFVIGDLAAHVDARSGAETPGVAQGAIQMGQHVARIIRDEARRGVDWTSLETADARAKRPAFRYFDKGMLATIGRNRAVAVVGGRRIAGTIAWLLWALVHVMFLIGFRNRLLVMMQWAWTYFTFQRGARLITGGVRPTFRKPGVLEDEPGT